MVFPSAYLAFILLCFNRVSKVFPEKARCEPLYRRGGLLAITIGQGYFTRSFSSCSSVPYFRY